MFIFVGSIGGKGSISGNGEGVYTLYWDENDNLVKTQTAVSRNAGIICMSKDRKYLYAANETKDFTGLNGSGGGVTAFRIDWNTGKLTKLNDTISYGSRTAYVEITGDGKYLLAANHGSHSTVTCHYVKAGDEWKLQRGFDDASVAVFRLHEDGSIGRLTDLKVFDGHGYWCYGGGQSTSHIHSVKIRNNLVIAANRGADRLEIMRLDEDNGTLTMLNRYHTHPAFAPRHTVFHPSANVFYTVNENYPCVTAYTLEENGTVKEIQTTKTMPREYYQDNPLPDYHKNEADEHEVNTSGMADMQKAMPSDIHIRPDGRFVYVSNRRLKGTGSIATLKVNPDYSLSLVNVFRLNGSDPRGFQLTDDNRYLIAGLADKNLVQIFELDEESGVPGRTAGETFVNSPASFAL